MGFLFRILLCVENTWSQTTVHIPQGRAIFCTLIVFIFMTIQLIIQESGNQKS